jgi:hypothetical protein
MRALRIAGVLATAAINDANAEIVNVTRATATQNDIFHKRGFDSGGACAILKEPFIQCFVCIWIGARYNKFDYLTI